MKSVIALASMLVALALPSAVDAAEPEAPIAVPRSGDSPAWPLVLGRTYYGQTRARAGSITVDFVLGPDGAVYEANTAKMKLPKSKRMSKDKYALEDDFDIASINAVKNWFFAVPTDACGTIRGAQAFDFDGGQQPPVAVGKASAMTIEAPPSVDQVLEPLTLAGSVLDPSLAPQGSMARKMPSRVMKPMAVRARATPLPARNPPAADLAPAILGSWAVDAFVAAVDIRERRQLAIAEFTIGTDGKASKPKVDVRYGDDDFGEAVEILLASAVFTPAQRSGAPVAVKVCQAFGSVVFADAPAVESY